jgi:hypothetical protein
VPIRKLVNAADQQSDFGEGPLRIIAHEPVNRIWRLAVPKAGNSAAPVRGF